MAHEVCFLSGLAEKAAGNNKINKNKMTLS
jgi:hypothetical protein